MTIHIRNRKALDKLFAILKKGKVPHAFLFTGMEGSGKRHAAIVFARALNCRNKAIYIKNHDASEKIFRCSCRSCTKIKSDRHPDIHRVSPDGTYIKIDRIRELGRVLYMKPYEAETRVAIIEKAHMMNREAANALLKALEEPPDNTVIILTGLRKSDFLPTIVSRCQIIRFAPVSGAVIKKILMEKWSMDEDEAAAVFPIAMTCPEKIEDSGPENFRKWLRWRKWLLDVMEDLLKSGDKTVKSMLFAEKLARKKETVPQALDIIKTWLRDLIICGYSPQKVINRDILPGLLSLAAKMEIKSIPDKIRIIQHAQRDIQANMNPRLTMEVMVWKLMKNMK